MASNKWMKFFTDAGLPPHVAANYSIIFTENRMDVDMLMDLSKEYLYDMGIRLMGDVIAILRHARTAYTEAQQEKMLRIAAPSGSLEHQTTTNRLVDRYLQNARNSVQTSFATEKNNPDIAFGGKKIISLKRRSDNDRLGHVKKYRVRDLGDTLDPTSFSDVEQGQSQFSKSTKSVFKRLGESSVSSSTDVVGRKDQSAPSIFARLGPTRAKTIVNASSTVDDDDDDDDDYEDDIAGSDETTLQNYGIFKSSLPQRQTRDVYSRLGSKPISAMSITTSAPDPVRLIRKSLMESSQQGVRFGRSNIISLRNNDEQQRTLLQKRCINLATAGSAPLVKKSFLTNRSPIKLPANYRVVKKPKNETTVFDRLGPL